jgi:hypothetical protein
MLAAYCRTHAIALLFLVTTAAAQALPQSQPPLWSAKPDVAAFEKIENDRLAAAQPAIDQMVAVSGANGCKDKLKTPGLGGWVRRTLLGIQWVET